MRGAVAFALALHMNVQNMENKHMLLTSTLFVVLFSIIFMGSTALPLIKVLDGLFPNEGGELHEHTKHEPDDTAGSSNSGRRKIVLSKTQEMNLEFEDLMHSVDIKTNSSLLNGCLVIQ